MAQSNISIAALTKKSPDRFPSATHQQLTSVDWQILANDLNTNGYATIENLLLADECEYLVQMYPDNNPYRSVINMQRYRFGLGEYKYFSYPLPPMIQSLRETLYSPLALVANEWMQKLETNIHYPKHHQDLLKVCHNKSQLRPTPLILRYEQGGFNTLHQDLYGEIYFPFQVVFLLSQVHQDFEGGEFVLTEQIPRAQSKAKVLQPNRGDAVIFTTNFRPIMGTRGYYKAKMKHGVSEINSGIRYSMGIIFHDAA
jgi:uncharacterized protein